jgi:hypothetical protein
MEKILIRPILRHINSDQNVTRYLLKKYNTQNYNVVSILYKC